MNAITYPPRPVNGGPLDKAMPKLGEWYYEPKYNGWRALVHVPTGTMFNRNGERLSIAGEFKTALDKLRTTLDTESFKWVDCEALERRHNIGRGALIVLDVVPNLGMKPTYVERRSWLPPSILPEHYPSKKVEDDALYQVAGGWLTDEGVIKSSAMEYWGLLQEYNARWGCEFYEGLVAKRADSIYPIQLISPDREFPFWVKHRWKF